MYPISTAHRPRGSIRAGAAAIALGLALAVPRVAAGADGASVDTPVRDPWVPPSLRKAMPVAPAHGDALKAQIERKLRASFDDADVAHRGRVTREEARRAGLGVVANNFEQIDVERNGSVSFDDLKRYLRSRGADIPDSQPPRASSDR
jgi:hypothetical protein